MQNGELCSIGRLKAAPDGPKGPACQKELEIRRFLCAMLVKQRV
jgi:hypothetical protein